MTFEQWMAAHGKRLRLRPRYAKSKQQWLKRAYDLFVTEVTARGGRAWSFVTFQKELPVSYPTFRKWCQDEFVGYRTGWRRFYGKSPNREATPRHKKSVSPVHRRSNRIIKKTV
jgi:hypothetical protein